MDFAPSNLPEVETRLAKVRQAAAASLAEARAKMKKRHESQRAHGPKHAPLIAGELVCIASQDATRGHKDRAQWFGPVKLSRVAYDGLRCFYMDEEGVERVVPAHLVHRYVLRPTRWAPPSLLQRAPAPLSDEVAEREAQVHDGALPTSIPLVSSPPNGSSSPEALEPSSSPSSSSSPSESPTASPAGSRKNHFVIDSIIGARGTVGKKRHYRVRWEGYGPHENTWEPEASIPPAILREAMRKFDFPTILPDDQITFPLHVDEISVIDKISSRRVEGRSEARIFHVVLTFDAFRDGMKADIEFLPPEVFENSELWESPDLFRRGQAARRRFQP